MEAIRRLEQEPTPEVIAASVESDLANRNEDVKTFVQMLNRIEGPFIILVDGPWGDGKTFFVKTVEQVLKALNPQLYTDEGIKSEQLEPITKELENETISFLPFYFNAWENDFAEDPTTAILASMAVSFNRADMIKKRKVSELLPAAIDAALSITPISLRVSSVADSLKGDNLVESYSKRTTLRGLINKLAEESNLEIANKLVIFIDDLDRCRPDFAVKLLEQVKHLFQSKNLIVVISTDSVQLAHAISGLYGSEYDSTHFIERFFDRRLTLTPCDPYQVATGMTFQTTKCLFDMLVEELLKSRRLTPRDVIRIEDKIAEARKYVNLKEGRESQGYQGFALTAAENALLPVLVFMERDDQKTFRNVVNGNDYEALYEYGKHYDVFNETIDRAMHESHFEDANQDYFGTPEARKFYVRSLCMAIYAPDQNIREVDEARHYLRIQNLRFDAGVFKRLEFPENQDM